MRPQVDILLDTDQSNDVVGIVELSVPPGWDGPPLHHHDFDEAFYVLEGELTFQLGEQLRGAGPGELIFAPRGAIHTLANLSERQARYILVCTPGQFTRYFEQPSATVSTATATGNDKRYPETIVVGPTIPDRLGGPRASNDTPDSGSPGTSARR
jgi:quercetin dioxygenase-like cupin family protein